MMIEILFQAAVYTTTIIATLRAGSRALYAFQHENEIGTMDGPLILSPHDVIELKKQGKSDVETSPLWEFAYAFGEAVRLLHDTTNLNWNDVFIGDWKEEEKVKRFYSMAAPYKTFQYEGIKYSLQQDESSEEHVPFSNDPNSVVLTESRKKIGRKDRFKSQWKHFLVLTILNISKRLKPIRATVNEILKYHPLFQKCFTPKLEQDETYFEIVSNIDLDFDTFYATTLELPSQCPDQSVRRIAKLKSYAPKLFSKLRKRFNVSETAFLTSILDRGPYVSFQSNSKGAARAGGFFFFTRDGAYMIKTIKKAEVKAVLNMLPKYYEYMKQNSRKTLLTRFFGLYSIKLGQLNSIDEEEERFFLIMNSVFPAESGKFISERYDLKGSTIGRECSKEERESKGSFAVLKDLDLAKEVEVMKSISKSYRLPGYGFAMGPTAKAALLEQLRRDLNLLVECSVMDYSLLVGVVNMEVNEEIPHHPDIPRHLHTTLRTDESGHNILRSKLSNAILAPLRQLSAPGVFICEKAYDAIRTTMSTVLTLPLPYYGAGLCGVDGGAFSVIPGRRLGKRAIYYMGVIDFLQPWTSQKVVERELKGMIGYNKSQISCVDPKEYAERFLAFIEKNIC